MYEPRNRHIRDACIGLQDPSWDASPRSCFSRRQHWTIAMNFDELELKKPDYCNIYYDDYCILHSDSIYPLHTYTPSNIYSQWWVRPSKNSRNNH